MDMETRKVLKLTAWTMALVIFCSFLSPMTSAVDSSVQVSGKVFSFGEDAHYEYSSNGTFEAAKAGVNTYGSFSLLGSLSSDGSKGGVPSFLVTGDTAKLIYSYTNSLLTASDESWHLVEDKTKKVNDLTLPSNINYGALILQTSKDGSSWHTDLTLTNLFEDTPTSVFPSTEV